MKTLALALMTAAIFGSATAIAAAEVTQTSYKEQVEPICQKSTTEIKKDLKGVKKEIKHNKLKSASVKVAKAGKALSKVYGELALVQQPAESTATLSRWLGYLKTEASLTKATAKALKAGKKSKASKLEGKLVKESERANETVVTFQFHFCHSELQNEI